jgi:hypothetical protein
VPGLKNLEIRNSDPGNHAKVESRKAGTRKLEPYRFDLPDFLSPRFHDQRLEVSPSV